MLRVILPLLLSYFISAFNFCQFDHSVSWCESLWVLLVWNSLGFLNLDICFLSIVKEVFSHNFFKLSFLLLSLPSVLLGPL